MGSCVVAEVVVWDPRMDRFDVCTNEGALEFINMCRTPTQLIIGKAAVICTILAIDGPRVVADFDSI